MRNSAATSPSAGRTVWSRNWVACRSDANACSCSRRCFHERSGRWPPIGAMDGLRSTCPSRSARSILSTL
ncbi:Uncharacterised protein [Bordetella pertussis]|nr:Uncharacterised protein [Bordetella pertussis]CFW29958.1 Uncharacterised protein [Bordetella pertussis]